MMLSAFPHAIPLEGLLGGLLIGISAAVMLLGLGRIAGVSGLAARAAGISNSGTPRMTAVAFITGLPLGAFILSAITGGVDTQFPPSVIPIIIGGLLVGYGTRLGSGCTSGHGVCGMSRLSPRSLLATTIFIGSGIAAVALMRAGGLL